MAAKLPLQGELWTVDLDPVEGYEQNGIRPVLVLSPGPFNLKTNLAVIVPLTTKYKGNPFEVLIGDENQGLEKAGLSRHSVILAHQVRTIDQKRMQWRIGQVNTELLNEVVELIHMLILPADLVRKEARSSLPRLEPSM